MSGPTVAAGVTSKVLELAVQRGADTQTLLARSGIDPAALQDFDGRIPLGKHIDLLRAAKEQCSDPAFALHYGEAVNLAEVSVVGLIGYAAPSISAITFLEGLFGLFVGCASSRPWFSGPVLART